ncbi:MAG TPA: hypothetical protein VKU84_07410 [Stellaceae bacterium]|nr:hypothetical protein [Stellaceae bacterium]
MTGLLTALLSSVMFSCLVAIGVFPLLGFGMPLWPIDPRAIVFALTVGLFAFWIALAISAFFSVIGATAFHFVVEAVYWISHHVADGDTCGRSGAGTIQ